MTIPCTHTRLNVMSPFTRTQLDAIPPPPPPPPPPGSTMSRISEISYSQSRPIQSTLTLHPREEHPHMTSLKASTSKSKSVTQDALMNEYDVSNLNATLVNKCKSRNVPYISDCSVCSACNTMRPLPPRAISSHMPKLTTLITYHLPCLTRSLGL